MDVWMVCTLLGFMAGLLIAWAIIMWWAQVTVDFRHRNRKRESTRRWKGHD